VAAGWRGRPVVREAARFLVRNQSSDGGFALVPGGPTNAQSTAWAVQGLLAAGRDPAAVTKAGRSPFEYLAARQDGDGHYTYSASSDQTPVWVTSQVMLAVNRETFPLAAVPRAPGGGAEGAAGQGSSAGNGRRAAGKTSNTKKDERPGADGSAVAGERASGEGADEGEAPAFEQTSSDDGGPSARQIVIGGLGLLVLALGGGFFLYRRRLAS
jgi:hypothetical protein